jgi:hypothetical protein
MSETQPLLGEGHAAEGDNETSAQTFDRADLKSTPVTLLTIASVVLATVCLITAVALKLGFDLVRPPNPYYGFSGILYLAIGVAFVVCCPTLIPLSKALPCIRCWIASLTLLVASVQALPIFILDIVNIASTRRHGRTIATAINIIADGLVIVFVLSRLPIEGFIPKLDRLSELCRIYRSPGPPYTPGQPPVGDPWDRNCMHSLNTLVVFIWIFEVSALLFGLVVHSFLMITGGFRISKAQRPPNVTPDWFMSPFSS